MYGVRAGFTSAIASVPALQSPIAVYTPGRSDVVPPPAQVEATAAVEHSIEENKLLCLDTSVFDTACPRPSYVG